MPYRIVVPALPGCVYFYNEAEKALRKIRTLQRRAEVFTIIDVATGEILLPEQMEARVSSRAY